MITDHIMLDVLRSTTTTPGELCVGMALVTERHKSPATCSDFGDYVFPHGFKVSKKSNVNSYIALSTHD